jgi:hypothetical protein
MGTPFPSGITGDPKRFERSVATHPTLGRPIPTNGYHDGAGYGGSISPAPETITPQAVALGGAPLRALPGKSPMGTGPWLMGDIDCANPHLIIFLANLFRRYSRTDLGSGALLWRFDLDQAEIADAYLAVRDWTDVIPLFEAFDGKIGGFQVGAQAGQNLAIQFPVGFGSYRFHGVVVQEVGAASTLPVLTGVSEHHFALAAVDGDVWIEATDVTGSAITLRSSYGGAAAPGTWSATQVYTMGDPPARLYGPLGARLGAKTTTAGRGSISDQVRIYWPAGSTVVTGDRFRVPKRGAEPAFTLPDARSISSVNSVVVLDGEEIETEVGWQITVERAGFSVQPRVHGRQGGTPKSTGDLTAVATATREITDLTVQRALHERQQLALFVDAEADEVIPGGSNLPYRIVFALPSCQTSGPMYGPDAGAQNTQEAATLTAGLPADTVSYAGQDFDQHLSVLVWTDADPLPFTPPAT